MKKPSRLAQLSSLPLLVPLGLGACVDTLDATATATDRPSDPLGHIVAAIAVVQPGVNCVRVSTHDLTTDALVRRKFPVTPGQAATFDLGLMTNGTTYRVWGEAYSQLCASVSNSTTPGWLSNVVAARVTLGEATRLQLDFSKNHPVSVSADFRAGIDRVALDTTGTFLLDEDGTLFSAGAGQLFRTEDPTIFGESWIAGPVLEWSYYNSTIEYLTDLDGDVVLAPRDAVAVAGAEGARCAVTTAGEIMCWGKLPWLFAFQWSDGQLHGTTSLALPYPSPFPAVSNAIDVTVGFDHACTLLDDTHGLCWGTNTSGQVEPSPMFADYLPFRDLGGGLAQIAAGHGFTCARYTSGAVACWGSLPGFGERSPRTEITERWNAYSQSADGPLIALGPAKTLAVGRSHACALMQAPWPRVACWGSNMKNQLARPRAELGASSEALTIGFDGRTPIDLAVSGDHTCVLTTDANDVRQVHCWGGDAGTVSTAALGRGFVVPTETLPGFVIGDLLDARRLFGGPLATGFCALKGTGSLVCWGQNAAGQLAIGSREAAWTPTPVR